MIIFFVPRKFDVASKRFIQQTFPDFDQTQEWSLETGFDENEAAYTVETEEVGLDRRTPSKIVNELNKLYAKMVHLEGLF